MISAMNPVKTTSVPSVEQQKAQAQEELDLAVQANVQYNKSNNITQTPKTTYTAPEPPSPPSFNENPKMYRNPAREVVNSVVSQTKNSPVKPTTYTAPESKMSIPNFNKWRGELSKTASKAPDLDLPDENQRNFAKGIFGDEEEKTAYNKMVYDIFAPPKTEEQLFIEGFEGVEDDEPDKMWKTEISENPDYTFKEPSKESVVVEKKPRTGLEQMLGQVKEKIDALAKTEYGYQPIKFVDGATVRDAQRAKYGKYLDVASDVLTVASVIPGIDTVTNAIQLPIDLVRGDFLGAGADLLGIIPFVGEIGDAAKTARLGAKAISRADDVSDLGRAAVKYGDELADTAKVASEIEKVSPYALVPTHAPTLSNKQYADLVEDIGKNGIRESIKYVEHNGRKYIVDGHHRLKAAKQLDLTNVPIEKVALPYKGYNSVDDLFWGN